MERFLEYIVKNLVDYPENVKIAKLEGEMITIIELSVDKSDIGKIIGKKGGTITALRTIAGGVARKTGRRVTLEIVDEEPFSGRRRPQNEWKGNATEDEEEGAPKEAAYDDDMARAPQPNK